jgi:hypothetical protein
MRYSDQCCRFGSGKIYSGFGKLRIRNEFEEKQSEEKNSFYQKNFPKKLTFRHNMQPNTLTRHEYENHVGSKTGSGNEPT